MEDTIIKQFNQIISKHYERLTGSKNVAGGIPLTLVNMACFVLVGGRELEMFDITSDVSERYTMDELLKEVDNLGIPKDEHFQAALQELLQKKYIDPRPDGHVYGYSDCRDTARTLNNIFPKIPGVSLLAYIWQTIAELESGRTDLESALSRVDQTLNNHGVAPAKPKIPVLSPLPPQKTEPPVEEKKEPETIRKSSRIIRDYVVSQTSITANTGTREFAKPVPPQSSKETVLPPEVKLTAIDREIQDQTAEMRQKIAELEKSLAETEKEKSENPAAGTKEEPAEVAVENAVGESTPVDDEIAQKIAAFEKELALVCPICKTGILQEKTTAAGKVFYACESKSCNFISWGKPHNIQCVRCKNPFLIEVKDPGGQSILRCPRATCQHRQALNPGGVKVVRKRLVRRKT